MALTLQQIAMPALLRGFANLSNILTKGAQHAASAGIDPDTLLDARLAPEMFPLSGQIQLASDTAKLGVARLAGIQAPVFADDETTFKQLQQRVERTVAFLESLPRDAIADDNDRIIQFSAGPYELKLTAAAYITVFMLPNFYFHVTTAYDILRQQGAPLGKLDYLGNPQA